MVRRHAWLLLGVAFASAECAPQSGKPIQAESFSPASTRPSTPSPIVIVTLDGVRWQEVFEGTDPALSGRAAESPTKLFPNLQRLGRELGAFVGAPGRGMMKATGPEFLSLPGYNEIFGGRAPIGCANNECPRTTHPTFLDDARDRGARVAAFASWERLDLALSAYPGSFHVDCGRGMPPTPQFSGSEESRPNRMTAAAALSYYEAERPDVFYLGLGDSDELAHEGDYAGYVAAIRFADEVLGRLLELISRDPRGRATHLVVTADHGRSSAFRSHGGFAPEAARVWMAIAGPRVLGRGAVATEREIHLADVAPSLRMATALGPETSDPSPLEGRPIAELFAPRL